MNIIKLTQVVKEKNHGRSLLLIVVRLQWDIFQVCAAREGKMIGKLPATLALAVGLMTASGQAIPQIGVPEPINGPVRPEWRGPYERFLRELGVLDPGAIVGKTNAFEIGGRWHPNSI